LNSLKHILGELEIELSANLRISNGAAIFLEQLKLNFLTRMHYSTFNLV